MLEVTAQRIIRHPERQVLSSQVKVHGFDSLTPKAARAALEIAFGNSSYGEVVDTQAGYGYTVYEKSARKFWR